LRSGWASIARCCRRGAGALLVGLLARHLAGHATTPTAGRAGLALCSFVVTAGHGTGLMLVPALVPLRMGTGPVRAIAASGSLALALAAVAVHTAAMLCASGLFATGACRAVDRGAGLPRALEGRAGHDVAGKMIAATVLGTAPRGDVR
jgi:hypothetical protein